MLGLPGIDPGQRLDQPLHLKAGRPRLSLLAAREDLSALTEAGEAEGGAA
ncbi:hypothetical protein [Actinoplanes sp. NPDC048796]